MNRRTFLKIIGLFIAASVGAKYVKTEEPKAVIEGFTVHRDTLFDPQHPYGYDGDFTMEAWLRDDKSTEEWKQTFETGTDDIDHWNYRPIDMVTLRRTSYVVTWDADVVCVYKNGKPTSIEELKADGIELNLPFDESQGSILWWTYDTSDNV